MSEPPLVGIIRIHQLACSGMGSPFYADLLERMADDVLAAGPVGRFLAGQLDTSYEEAVPLRFLGGVHRLVLAGRTPSSPPRFPSVGGDGDAAAAWPAMLSVLDSHANAVRDALTRPPQTNEVGRSAALVGGFLVVARDHGLPLPRARGRQQRRPQSPLRPLLVRVGRDRIRRRRFAGALRRSLGGRPAALRRADHDRRTSAAATRDPIDARTEDGRLTLLSYVWPGQTERFTMLRAPRSTSPGTCRSRSTVPTSRLAGAPARRAAPGRATVVFHSIVWQYLTDDERATAEAALATAGERATRDAPLAWLRLEPSADLTHTELRVTTWPTGEERLLARCHYHLGPMQWVA